MKRLLLLVVLILMVSVVFAQQAKAPIALTQEEQKEILEIQNQIDKLKLLQENAILRAANEHGVSLKKYELAQANGQLVFAERPQSAPAQTKP